MTENLDTSPSFWARFRAAQRQMRDPVQNATNPHFRSRFVTLKGVLDVIRPALHENGLAISQTLDIGPNGLLVVVTSIRDDAGMGVLSTTPILCTKPNDPQAFGSAATYARRYASAAICCLAPADDDDDAETASPPRASPPSNPKNAPKAKAEPQDAPYASADAAGSAINASPSQDALRKIGAQIASCGFLEEERAVLGDMYQRRMAALKEAP